MIVRFWAPTRTITSVPIFLRLRSPLSANGTLTRRVALPLAVTSC